MAKVRVWITGDRDLDRVLRKLAGPKLSKATRSALRDACKIVKDYAVRIVPVRSGAFRNSLTVRAGRRSRKGIRYIVTQRSEMMRRPKGSSREKAFYGAFVEYGFVATGRPKTQTWKRGDFLTAEDKNFVRKHGKHDPEKVSNLLRMINMNLASDSATTYRGTEFSVLQLRRARKIPGQWVLYKAATDKHLDAYRLWVDRLQRFIETEAR